MIHQEEINSTDKNSDVGKKLMVKLLLGIWTEDSWIVRYVTPNFTKKEANQLLDNVLFSTNIYGQKTATKKDIAFTLPIMYLPGYTHGRIYFKFNSKSSEKLLDPLIINILSQPVNNSSPISLFLSFKTLTDELDSDILSEIDILVWNFLQSELNESNFHNLVSSIDNIIQKIL